MTAEDVDLDISIAFDKLTLATRQQPSSYLCDHEIIIFKKQLRSWSTFKKRKL